MHLANAQALTVLFALLSCKIPAHLFAKPPAEVHNARQCSGIVCAFRLVEAQNHGASIRKPLAIEYNHNFWYQTPMHRPEKTVLF